MTTRSRRPLLSLVFLFVSLVALAVAPTADFTVAAQDLEPVTVGISGHSMNFLPPILAEAKGFTEKHGLDVTHVYLQGGTPTTQALVAGEFPLAIESTTIMHARLQGFDPVLVASFVPHLPYHLMSRGDIRSADDLRGGRAAISTPGAVSDGVVRLAISRLGLVPERDVAILPIGGQTARLAAIDAGTVDATVVSPPISYQLLDQGYYLLLDLMAEQIPSNHENVITTRQVVDEQPELVKKYLRALGEALHYIHTEREGTVEFIADYLEMDLVTERDIIERTYEDYVAYNIAKVPYPLASGWRNSLEIGALQNPLVLDLDPWELIDIRPIRELEEEGFFESLYE